MIKKYLQIAFGMALILWAPSQLKAFNSATHLYIAEHVFQDSRFKLDLYYGSVAPDLYFFVKQPQKWPTALDDTHHQFVDLRPFASGLSQTAFANGWLTHNEKDPWGADHYAHIDPGYVIQKAKQIKGLSLDFAHLAVEVAIDVLLKKEDPQLGEKLLDALQFHSLKDRFLLREVLVDQYQRTDRRTLVLAEITDHTIMYQYAMALSLPSPDDKRAIAQWGVILAQKMYRMKVSPDMLLRILEEALELCKDDYKETVDAVIEGIKDNIGLSPHF